MADELVYFRGSPWSLKCVWAAHLLGFGTIYQEKLIFSEYNFPMGQLGLRFRLGDWSSPITIPILFPKASSEQPLRSSYDILHFLNNKAEEYKTSNFNVAETGNTEHVSSLSLKDEQVIQWDMRLDTVMRFLRGLMMKYDDITPYLVPIPVHYIPGALSLISSIQKKYFISKYGEVDTQISKEEVENILREANERLSQSSFLVGEKLTYADISLATALESMAPEDPERPITVMAPALNTHSLFKEMFDRRFPRLLPWKKQILTDHFSPNVEKQVLVPLTMKIARL
uniref:Glutathione S-transferase C-terminal domain-containing protein n=1 Tax=Aplanochytrium stocchinoi TaxID=215587 RepID=A0A7S3PJD3_9STRA